MNNDLEKIIGEHADELFGGEPLTGHRERFVARLDAVGSEKRISKLEDSQEWPNKPVAFNKKPIRRMYGYLSAAAIFIGIVILLHQRLHQESIAESGPLSEVQNYYSMQLRDKIDDIEQLLTQLDENDRSGLMSDIENMLREADSEIWTSGEKNTELIVMTYSSKMEALQHIHNLLDANFLTH
jgi:spore coat protein CotH